jgi:Tol biopolymer transport system component
VAPAWSPDGRTIAFGRGFYYDGPDRSQLWLIQPDGTGLRQLTDLPCGAGAPSWSPNGRRLAFETDVQTNQRRNIATIRADGSGIRALTHGGINLDPDWSR